MTFAELFGREWKMQTKGRVCVLVAETSRLLERVDIAAEGETRSQAMIITVISCVSSASHLTAIVNRRWSHFTACLIIFPLRTESDRDVLCSPCSYSSYPPCPAVKRTAGPGR